MNLTDFLQPELIAVSYALYVIGDNLKKSSKINDTKIPLILSILGIIFCTIYILCTRDFFNIKSIILGIFTGIIQGICTAGMSVYIHQLIKQNLTK